MTYDTTFRKSIYSQPYDREDIVQLKSKEGESQNDEKWDAEKGGEDADQGFSGFIISLSNLNIWSLPDSTSAHEKPSNLVSHSFAGFPLSTTWG
ncbi:hypothetical protein L9F63_013854, partial [Diploptera punctata]